MTNACPHDTPLTVHVDADLAEALSIARAAGADHGDLEYHAHAIDGVTILTARTADGLYALKTLLETRHAVCPGELYHSATLPQSPLDPSEQAAD